MKITHFFHKKHLTNRQNFSAKPVKYILILTGGDFIVTCYFWRSFRLSRYTRFGWDSYLERWFCGHTLYAISCYNEEYKTDLPLYLRFVGANRHDSVTGIVALAEFKTLSPQLTISNLVLDSANDNYPTYELCSEWNINPFIDLNPTCTGIQKYPSYLRLTDKGIPICMAEHNMIYDGYCKERSRHKWRCPLKCGDVTECSCLKQCSPSDYGRVIYTTTAF